MKYAESRFQQEQELLAFRVYMSDSLFYQAQEQRLKNRWYDLIRNVPKEPDEDIALKVFEGAGLRFE